MYFDSENDRPNLIDYRIQTINSDGTIYLKDKRSVVDTEIAGGFYGSVRILEDEPYVMKGTNTRSAIRKFTKYANWRFNEFPSQVNEQAAQLDFLTTKLLHLTLPALSDGKYYSPDAIGYTKLSDGYAQLIEKVKGRGPTYLNGMGDYHQFKTVQKELRELEYSLGFEHGAQIDEDNPLGLPNIWRDDPNSRWIHMDTIPAFQHHPTFGIGTFAFYKKAAKSFYPGQKDHPVTFNRLHTDKFVQTVVENHDKFTTDQLVELADYLNVYRDIRSDFDLTYHPKRQVKDAVKQCALGLVEIGASAAGSIVEKAKDTALSIVNPIHQQRQMFQVMEEAFADGLITEEEYLKSKADFFTDGTLIKGFISRAKTGGLFVTYGLVGAITHIPEVYLYSKIAQNTDLDPVSIALSTVATGATFTGARIVGGILRYPATKAFGAVFKTDLDTAARISLIPMIGDNIALIAQLFSSHKTDKTMVHYAVRDLLTNASKVIPTSWRKPIPIGGKGTDAEAQFIEKWGKQLEEMIESK